MLARSALGRSAATRAGAAPPPTPGQALPRRALLVCRRPRQLELVRVPACRPHTSPAPRPAAAVTAAAVAPAAATLPALALAASALLLSVMMSIFLATALPTMLAVRRAALEVARLARAVTAEVPDTAAAVRLSGLELSDAIEELGALG